MSPQHVRGNQPSRRPEDLRPKEADQFQYLALRDLSAAAALTAGWSRRLLLDVALTLATTRPAPIVRWLDTRDRETPLVNRTVGPRREVLEVAWTDENLRVAHGAFNAGQRSVFAVEGERMYQRISKRRRVTIDGKRQRRAS